MQVGEDGVLMIPNNLKIRADLIVGLVVVAVSVAVAILMRRTHTLKLGSCINRPCTWQVGYPVIDRLAVVAGGVLVALLIVVIGSFMRGHLGESRTGRK